MAYFQLDNPTSRETVTTRLEALEKAANSRQTTLKQSRKKRADSIIRKSKKAKRNNARIAFPGKFLMFVSILFIAYSFLIRGYFPRILPNGIIYPIILFWALAIYQTLRFAFDRKNSSNAMEQARRVCVFFAAYLLVLLLIGNGGFFSLIIPAALTFISLICDNRLSKYRNAKKGMKSAWRQRIFNIFIVLFTSSVLLSSIGATYISVPEKEIIKKISFGYFNDEKNNRDQLESFVYTPLLGRSAIFTKYGENEVALTEVIFTFADSKESSPLFTQTYTVPESMNYGNNPVESFITDLKFSLINSFNYANKVTRIESYAFYSTSNIETVVLPSSVTTIEANAFSNSGVKNLKISSSYTVIYDGFEGTSIENVYFTPGANATIYFINTLKDGVTLFVPVDEYDAYCQANPLYAEYFQTYNPYSA